jgi:hypothetical protein
MQRHQLDLGAVDVPLGEVGVVGTGACVVKPTVRAVVVAVVVTDHVGIDSSEW